MRIASRLAMPRISIAGVVTRGLLAGIVLIAVNVSAQILFGERVQRDMNAWMPGAADRLQTGGAVLALGLVLKLVLGIVLVWLYAAMRARFGPGPKTASLAALTVWVLGAIFFSDFPLIGMMSWTTYGVLETSQLVAFLLATWTGASLYREA